MKILVITQKIDEEDCLFGFFCTWLEKMAKRFEKIHVITLERGRAKLPENIFIYSLGKEAGYGRLRLFLNFHACMAKILPKEKVDIIFHGHTHKPWAEEKEGVKIINPGTLGGVFTPATFAIWDTAKEEPELKLLNY